MLCIDLRQDLIYICFESVVFIGIIVILYIGITLSSK